LTKVLAQAAQVQQPIGKRRVARRKIVVSKRPSLSRPSLFSTPARMRLIQEMNHILNSRSIFQQTAQPRSEIISARPSARGQVHRQFDAKLPRAGLVQMPTGSGKNGVIATARTVRDRPGPVIVMAPRIGIQSKASVIAL